MKFFEAPIGVPVVLIERMENETRWTYYERREGIAKFNPNPSKPNVFVPAYRLRTVQGFQNDKPRYDSGEFRVETEMDGRYLVVDAKEISHSYFIKKTDFFIGCEFMMSDKRWRCTDVGTRTINAICLSDHTDESWFNGPPYAVTEFVIDENDIPACEIIE